MLSQRLSSKKQSSFSILLSYLLLVLRSVSQSPKRGWVGATPQKWGFPNIIHLARMKWDVFKMHEMEMNLAQQSKPTLP